MSEIEKTIVYEAVKRKIARGGYKTLADLTADASALLAAGILTQARYDELIALM